MRNKIFLHPGLIKEKNMKIKSLIMDESALARTLKRISHEIIERNESVDNVCLIGIKTRGVPLANRIAKIVGTLENRKIETGELDITLYRDDLPPEKNESRAADFSNVPFDINGKTVILTDDVIYTGRTVRAALDAVMKLGRPAKIQLAVIVDRGHRELPIRADYVGKNIPTSRSEIVKVSLKEIDGTDSVNLME